MGCLPLLWKRVSTSDAASAPPAVPYQPAPRVVAAAFRRGEGPHPRALSFSEQVGGG